MAKIYLTELEEASSIYKDSFLSQDISTSNNVSGMINEFVTGTKSKLQGSMWDAVRGKMGEFQTAFSNFSKVSDNFCNTITNAVNKLQEVVGEDCNYDYLDDSKLDELNVKLNELKNKLETLKKGTQVTIKDKNGKETIQTQYDSDGIKACEAEINSTQNLIDKTEKFKEVYKEVLAQVEEAYNEVTSFASSVDGIEVSLKITYDSAKTV